MTENKAFVVTVAVLIRALMLPQRQHMDIVAGRQNPSKDHL